MGFTDDPGALRHMVCDIGVGAMMYRSGPAAYIQNTHRTIQNMAKIPLLLAANTEAGGNGLAIEGTGFGCPMAVSATDDPENGYRMGYVSCAEGAALGLNWSFAPIVDIDKEFHNPITNTRTFGSDPDKIIAFASRYMDAADENNVAVAIKHFPGDGVDERDQHILTSVNSLSADEWMDSYGKVYQTLIEKGKVSRPFVGISGLDIDEATAIRNGLTKGIYVDSVVSGSAAEEAGIEPGDIIVAFDGKNISKLKILKILEIKLKLGFIEKIKKKLLLLH